MESGNWMVKDFEANVERCTSRTIQEPRNVAGIVLFAYMEVGK